MHLHETPITRTRADVIACTHVLAHANASVPAPQHKHASNTNTQKQSEPDAVYPRKAYSGVDCSVLAPAYCTPDLGCKVPAHLLACAPLALPCR